MRPVTASLTLGLWLLLSPPVAGETALDVQLRAGQAPGQVVLVIGDLKGQPLTEPTTAALRFLVQWVKRDPAVETVPVIGYYETAGKLVTVDGLGEVDDIFERVVKAIESART